MAEYNEMTRHAFMSHMEDYIKKLLTEPLKADVDSFMKCHGFSAPDTLKLLLQKDNDGDENSAIVIRTETIRNGGFDDNGNRLKDKFKIVYKLPRKDYLKKMHKLYKKLYENSNIVDDELLLEDGECAGATTCDASAGQFIQPLGGKKDNVIKRKTIYITQEQFEHIKSLINEEDGGCPVQNTPIGSFGYDAPFNKGCEKDDFYKEANDHKDMMKKSFPGELEEDIDIKPENKGKFNATKKRTGKSTEELTHSKNPLTRKRAIFSQNAAKWHHDKK